MFIYVILKPDADDMYKWEGSKSPSGTEGFPTPSLFIAPLIVNATRDRGLGRDLSGEVIYQIFLRSPKIVSMIALPVRLTQYTTNKGSNTKYKLNVGDTSRYNPIDGWYWDALPLASINYRYSKSNYVNDTAYQKQRLLYDVNYFKYDDFSKQYPKLDNPIDEVNLSLGVFDYTAEPKIYMSPYREIIINNFHDVSKIPYEWNWLYSNKKDNYNKSRFKITPSLEGVTYDFYYYNTEFKGSNYNSLFRARIKDTKKLTTLTNAYLNYIQNHINSYQTSMGLANWSQNSLINEPWNMKTMSTAGILPIGISSALGSVANIFTGESSKKIMSLKAQMMDLQNVPDQIKNASGLDMSELLNYQSDYSVPNNIINAYSGDCILYNMNMIIKKPPKEILEKIAYHYHLHGYNVEGIPLATYEVFCEKEF